MNNRRYHISALTSVAAALLLAACSEVTDLLRSTEVDYGAPLQLTASGSSADSTSVTRAADGLYTASTGFTGGEQAEVYMYYSGTKNATYDVAAPVNTEGKMVSALTPAVSTSTLYYPYGTEGSVWLYGVYPAASTAGHTVSYDQTADAAYKASDLMYATTRATWATSEEKRALKPNLEFHHQLVKLRLTIVKSETVKEITEVKLKNVKRSVSVTPESDVMTLGTPASADDGYGDEILLSGGEAASNDEKSYTYCCVFPAQVWGSGEEPADFLAITADGGTATYRLHRENWTTGYEYTLTLSLNAFLLGMTGTISDWTDNQYTYTINAAESEGGTLQVAAVGDQSYTSADIIPSPAPKVYNKDGDELTPSSDYTLAYYNNRNVGTALIVATGQGTYDGQIGIGSFNILSKDLTNGGSIGDIADQIYNGAEQRPVLTVVGPHGDIVPQEHYDAVYTDNKNAGTATVTITANGNSNYTGTLSKTFKILPRSLTTYADDFTVTLSKSSFTYTGSERSTTVSSVVDGGLATGTNYTMACGTDYTVGGTTSATAPGTYTVTVTGKGNYTGSTTATWSIGTTTVTITAKDQTVTYGTPITQGTDQVTVEGLPSGCTLAGITLTQNRTNAGTGVIKPSGAVIKNSSGTDITEQVSLVYKTGELTINKIHVTDWSISPTTMTLYVSASQNIMMYYGSGNNSSHGTVLATCSNPSVATVSGTSVTGVAVGTATITVTIGESTNYIYDGSRTCAVTVTDPAVALADAEVGYIVAATGKAYPVSQKSWLEENSTIVGMVAYKNGSSGIVIAKSNASGTYTWSQARSYSANAGSFYVSSLTGSTTSKTWICGTQEQYDNVLGRYEVSGTYNPSTINSRLEAAGCNSLGAFCYWTSTIINSYYTYDFCSGWWRTNAELNKKEYVRPMFVF